MTNFSVNVIVTILNGDSTTKNVEKIDTKEKENWIYESNSQHKSQEECLKSIRMKELHVSLKDATNYLISLFLETNKMYSCTRTKLGKLLSIVAFKYACKDILLFDEKVYKYNDCGAIIEGISAYTNMEAYINFKYEDGIKKVTDDYKDSILGSAEIDIESEVKNIIKDVFVNFGAYSASDLGEYINSIITCQGIVAEDDMIYLDKILILKDDIIKNSKNNNLITYLFLK